MQKLLTVLVSFLIFSVSLNAQSTKDQGYLYKIGIEDGLYSKTLKEHRKFWVHLPEGAASDKTKKYPLLVVLDGHSQLLKIRAIMEQLEGTKVPEMIIIGLDNDSNRLRDLTPTKPHNPSPAAPKPGEGAKFIQFIGNELIPYIDANYPTTSYRSLFGHSIGGLFVLNTLFSDSDKFDNYIAIDPSLWRGEDYDYLQEYTSCLEHDEFEGKSLFVGVANTMARLNMGLDTSSVMKNETRATAHIRHILSFVKTADKNTQNKLNVAWAYYGDEGHNSVVLKSSYDALCMLFKWYSEDIDQFIIKNANTSVEDAVSLIEKRYKRQSDHFGYSVIPEEEVLNRYGYQCLYSGQYEKSYAFFKMNIDYYPNSANVYDSMADYFEAKSDRKNALKYVRLAYEISGGQYHKNRIESFSSGD
jgi:predicted alpha/beta superfamily hydrolase